MKTRIRGAHIVTCDAKNSAFVGDVLVSGRTIEAIGPKVHVEGLVREIDGTGCAVIPGFVQAHVHLCQAIMRGMCDDLPLLEWLRKRVWPLEAAHDATSLAASAELGLVEMSRAGTTTILDMGTVHHYEVVFEACMRAGMRVVGGKTMMDVGEGVPRGLRETTAASLAESDRLMRSFTGAGEGRVHYAYSPRFILSCSEKLVRGVVERALESGTRMHSHAAEHPGEVEEVTRRFGGGDVETLRAWGFKGPRAVLAHGVQLTMAEGKRVAKDQTRFVHCPSANLKLGSGIAPVHDLQQLGVVFGLGADGAPCNNNLDPWIEMRHAALLAKVRTGVTTLDARAALRLATIDGARALAMDAEIGSIEHGKRADLVVVRIDGAHQVPSPDVVSALVYATKAADVEHVMCDGEWLVSRGESTRFDEGAVIATAQREAQKLLKRAKLR